VITVSQELKRLFLRKTELQTDKISVIPNGFDLSDFENIEKSINTNYFYISYVGTISEEYNSKALIEGLKNIANEVLDKIRLRFVGKVNQKTLNDFEKAGLGKIIELHDYVPHQKAIEYMISSRMLLLIIPDVKNNEGILTGKLFEYIACGRPVLFIGPENGDAAEIINETNRGIVCGYNDDKKITLAINEEFKKGQNEDKSIRDNKIMKYSRENLTKELVSIINSR
jgi:glycosyltransferase involved in cell wall biosynthesis